MNLTLPTPARVIEDRRLVDVALNNLQRTYDMKTPTPEEENPYESEEYQQFMDSVSHLCDCDGPVCPGVLAGGFCDQNRADPLEDANW